MTRTAEQPTTKDATRAAAVAQTAERPEPTYLTAGQIEAAMREIPAHRKDLMRDAQALLNTVRRHIPVKTSAPAWRQIQNAVFVSKIDVDDAEGE